MRHRAELVAALTAALASRTNSEWAEQFAGAGFPYGPVNKMSEVFSDPQVLSLYY